MIKFVWKKFLKKPKPNNVERHQWDENTYVVTAKFYEYFIWHFNSCIFKSIKIPPMSLAKGQGHPK